MMLPTDTNGEARENLRLVQSHAADFDLQPWDRKYFSALVRHLYGDKFELPDASTDDA